jgi:CHAT domain-containing protein/Tfp pilus assembly protein PilF
MTKESFSRIYWTAILMVLGIVVFRATAYPETAGDFAKIAGGAVNDTESSALSKNKESELQEHDRAGTDAYNKNDFKTAQKEFLASIKLSIELFGEYSAQTAHRYNSMALACYHQGEYDRAVGYYEKALDIYRKAGDESGLEAAFSYHGLGQCYQFKGEYDRAIELFSKALGIYRKDPEKNDGYIGTAYYDTGVAYQYKGEYGRAEDYFNKALVISRKAFGSDHAYVATLYYALGEISKFRGDFSSSIEYYQKALGIYHKAYGGDHPYVGTAYYALAYAYENRGEFEKAVAYYERARRIYIAAYGEKHPHVAVACHGLGNVYNAMGEYDKAITNFEKAVEVYLSVFGENHINTAASLNGLGSAYRAKGRYDKALVYFERMLAIQKKVLGENHPETGHSYVGIGTVLWKMGAYDKALRYFERARTIFSRALGERHPNVSHVLMLTGRLYRSMNKIEKARVYLERALSQFREKSLRTNIISASDALGVLYLDAGDPRRARPYFEESIGEIEKARIEAGADKVEFMRRYINSYYYSIRSSAMMDDCEAVFGTAEAMRARGFLDRMSLTTALAVEGIRKADREKLTALNDEIENLASRRSAEIRKPSSEQDAAAIVRISTELEQKEKAFGELDARLMKNEKYRSLRKPHIADLAEARSACGPDSAILEYVIWEENSGEPSSHRQSYCLVITKRGQRLVPLDRDFDYTGTIMKFRDAITGRGGTKERDDLGVLLYEKLIAPVEKETAGVKRIVIIPDGALAFLPFDALRQSIDAPYLCEQFTISLNPSVSVMLMVNKRKVRARRKAFLAFGGAVYSTGGGERRGKHRIAQNKGVTLKSKEYFVGEGTKGRPIYYRNLGLQWDNIPGTLEEVNEIDKSVYKRKKTRVIRGAAVSESKIKELSKHDELMRYKSIHFACHGYYDPDMPSYSAVVLSEVSGSVKSTEDGYLSVPEVVLLKLQADIVNLSACETGLGRIVQGDGIIGLARAFQEAGSNRVGVTLWEVADEPTKNFMIGVYRRAVRGKMSFGDAVSETKREFIRSRAFNDPYFWSAFVLYGR